MSEEKRPRWEEEVWKGSFSPDDICCKTCMFKMQPAIIGGETIQRHTFGTCDLFDNKPREILQGDAQCEFYEKE